jgi:hypothetical protein|tara:strand:- start:192 stop:395 length:204 start_codon:yes stop_codon:yes gene_type:complete
MAGGSGLEKGASSSTGAVEVFGVSSEVVVGTSSLEAELPENIFLTVLKKLTMISLITLTYLIKFMPL